MSKSSKKCIISIIIPIYNAESTLFRCLDSFKAQTFTDFEVLMINDGSPDRCGIMIDEYAQKDNRFKAIHRHNGGVSAARQCGIDHAQGEYTIHADPDDWVEPTMLEELYAKAKEEDADMIICDFYENTYKGQKYIKQQPSSLSSEVVVKELFQHLHGSCCNKLIRRECYEKYDVKFPLGVNFCEDLYVNSALILHHIKISYLNLAFYHYVRMNDTSLSRKYTEQQFMADRHLNLLFEQLFINSEAKKYVKNAMICNMLSRAFFLGKDLFSSYRFKKEFFIYRKVIIQSKYSMLERLLIYLSCWGLYQPIRSILYFAIFLRRRLNTHYKI